MTKYAAKGVHERTLAAILDCDPDTFTALKKRDPRVVAAIEIGRAQWHDRCAATINKAAERQWIPALAILKNRFGWRENDTPTDTRATVIINLPGAANPADYVRGLTVDAEREALPAPKIVAQVKRG